MSKPATNIQAAVGEARLLKHLEQVVERGLEDKPVLLPLQIKHVRLENIGPFRFFEAQLRRDQVNLLFGLGGAGKSVVLSSIALCFGIPNKYFQHIGRMGRPGKIDIEVYPFGNRVSMKGRQATLKTRFLNAQCVLLDEPFDYLVPGEARRLVDTLRRMRKQVILALKLSYVKDAVPSKNTVLIPYSLSSCRGSFLYCFSLLSLVVRDSTFHAAHLVLIVLAKRFSISARPSFRFRLRLAG